MSAPACAYLVSRYPSVTHTFVTGEVRALRDTGVRVETASIRQVPPGEALSEADRQELERTWVIVPPSPWRLLRSHVRALRHPRDYFGTLWQALRMAHAGGRARVWQLFYFGEAILLWAWMRGHGVHHIHVHHANVSADVALLACAYANRDGTAPPWTWSITIHGPTELLDVEAHKLAAKIADAAAVVCISDFARSQVAALADPATLEKVHTVRCGIDLAAFAPPGSRGEEASARILCVAALSRRKGHVVLLEAMPAVLERVPAARLTLAGGGTERDFLEQRVAELGVAHAVEFLGAVEHDRMSALYEAADVFCLPSFAEGIPIVLMEAMAMEIPVVATEIMGVPELVDDEQSGLLVPPARPELLAAALVRLLTDSELRERMGREGRRRVAADYDITGSAARLRELLEPLIR
ncbi:MAG: glycosyltransferase family 4 protein [Thermoleophilaceae bacterium]